jgi:hypothetical protein
MKIAPGRNEYKIVPILLWGLENMYAQCYLNEVNFYSLQCDWQGQYPGVLYVLNDL